MKFVAVCEELKDVGLHELERRKEERSVYLASHEETCTHNQNVSVKRVLEYEELKVKVNIPVESNPASKTSHSPQFLGAISSTPNVGKQLDEAINTLYHDLMQLEMLLVEQIEASDVRDG